MLQVAPLTIVFLHPTGSLFLISEKCNGYPCSGPLPASWGMPLPPMQKLIS